MHTNGTTSGARRRNSGRCERPDDQIEAELDRQRPQGAIENRAAVPRRKESLRKLLRRRPVRARGARSSSRSRAETPAGQESDQRALFKYPCERCEGKRAQDDVDPEPGRMRSARRRRYRLVEEPIALLVTKKPEMMKNDASATSAMVTVSTERIVSGSWPRPPKTYKSRQEHQARQRHTQRGEAVHPVGECIVERFVDRWSGRGWHAGLRGDPFHTPAATSR